MYNKQSKHIDAEKARRLLPSLIDQAQKGSAFIVTHHGKACAAIEPLQYVEEHAESFLSLCSSGTGLWGDDVAESIRNLREEWT